MRVINGSNAKEAEHTTSLTAMACIASCLVNALAGTAATLRSCHAVAAGRAVGARLGAATELGDVSVSGGCAACPRLVLLHLLCHDSCLAVEASSRMSSEGGSCRSLCPCSCLSCVRDIPSTAGNSMTGSERPSLEPLLKKGPQRCCADNVFLFGKLDHFILFWCDCQQEQERRYCRTTSCQQSHSAVFQALVCDEC